MTAEQYLIGLAALDHTKIRRQITETAEIVRLLQAGKETQARHLRGVWHDLPNARLHATTYEGAINGNSR